MEMVAKLTMGRGKGVIRKMLDNDNCLCLRSRCHVLCSNCGFYTYGRVRYTCPSHPQTIYLIDLTQCPNCRAYQSLLSEFERT